jgi:hypothetical protein
MVRFLFALNPQAAIDLLPYSLWRAIERPLWLAELEIVADGPVSNETSLKLL